MPWYITNGNTTDGTDSKFSIRVDTGKIVSETDTNAPGVMNYDGVVGKVGTMVSKIIPTGMTTGTTGVTGYFRVRPTNTSVLYCIKY